MKHLTILVPQGEVSVANIAGAHQIFTQVNIFLEQSGKPPLFKIQLVGLRQENKGMQGLIAIHPEALINDVNQTDLIIIPAIHGDPHRVIEANKEFIPWIAADEFRRMFPKVNLVPDKIITDEQGIYSSGGAYSGLNLLLYLVEKYA